jgi:hypothetical protein
LMGDHTYLPVSDVSVIDPQTIETCEGLGRPDNRYTGVEYVYLRIFPVDNKVSWAGSFMVTYLLCIKRSVLSQVNTGIMKATNFDVRSPFSWVSRG